MNSKKYKDLQLNIIYGLFIIKTSKYEIIKNKNIKI